VRDAWKHLRPFGRQSSFRIPHALAATSDVEYAALCMRQWRQHLRGQPAIG